jgi:CRP-like cAMP-binding protein
MLQIKEVPVPIDNRLLAALPLEDYYRMVPKLEKVELKYEDKIYQKNDEIHHVYFPSSGIISLLTSVEDNLTLEVGLIGKEGMLGLSLFLGVKTSNNQAIVQGAGIALRMTAEDFLIECQNCSVLPRILQRFTHSRLNQVSQSAACYRFHPIESRLARWLLMTADRMEAEEFQTTQEFLSNMLGVRREAVNKSAVALQHQKLIRYSRGHISIMNRQGLEKATCLCYGIIKNEETIFPVSQILN